MKKIEKAPSRVLKTLKLEAKNAASKTQASMVHDSLNASSWKKDILEGRKKVVPEAGKLSAKTQHQDEEKP
jgi:hypothetical protein